MTVGKKILRARKVGKFNPLEKDEERADVFDLNICFHVCDIINDCPISLIFNCARMRSGSERTISQVNA